MSEKKEDHTMEDQNSSYDNLNDNTTMESDKLERVNSTNESQDFHLVDTSDDESESKSQCDLESTKQKEEPSNAALPDNSEEIPNKKNTIECKAPLDAEYGDLPKEEDVQDTESVKKLEEKEEVNESASKTKDKDSDEDDEVIQCTPPECNETPSNKKSAENVIRSLKRKGESFEEPAKKILKTGSKEDLSEKREEMEKEDNYHSEDDTQPEVIKNCTDTYVVIAETQDDEIEVSIENPMRHEEKTKVDERQPEFENHETDKNENFNDATKLNDEEISDRKNLTQSSENKESPVEMEVTDSVSPASPLKTIEEAKSNLEQSDVEEVLISKDTNESDVYSGNICKNRMSVEFIKAISKDEKEIKRPKELVEIDEEGEKIVLDSSQEDSLVKGDSEQKNVLDDTKNSTAYKSCYENKSSSEKSYKTLGNTKESSLDFAKSSSKLMNGSSESKRCDTDTVSLHSDAFSDTPILDKTESMISRTISIEADNEPLNRKQSKSILKLKDSDLFSVSDNEPEDHSYTDDKNKSNLAHRSHGYTKEFSMHLRVKCSLQFDESSKEFLTKEITNVHCEASGMDSILRPKNHDTSASMADISGNDNRDMSPGSVNSNPTLYQLNPSRFSFASTTSSLSSASSAASLAIRFINKDNPQFSLPKGPAKHAKKQIHDVHSLNDKQVVNDMCERLSREWQNSNLLTAVVLNSLNAELTGTERDTYNVSQEKIEQLDQLQKIRSSTPELQEDVVPQPQTSKSTKKAKAVKRQRSKNTKSADGQSNGLNKISKTAASESSSTPNKKKFKTAEQRNDTWSVMNVSTGFEAQVQPQIVTDELIGKTVFAKWSDNNYYPGKVIDKVKNKYNVSFHDGKKKALIEGFLIPIPEVLKNGLSIYATTEDYDYGLCGIIVESEIVNNEIYYIVETDEGEKLRIQIEQISLSFDQAQLLKEEINTTNKALPSTPKQFAQVTLDNMVEGKRRSKRIATPNISTNSTPNIPKSKSVHTPSKSEPSVSGISSRKRKMLSDSDPLSSDSNLPIKDDILSIGVQAEIIGTAHEQIVKGPQSRIKSKSRSKKKPEDKETIALLGPIPEPNSNIFKGMSFLLTCVSPETIDRFQVDNMDCSTDVGTTDEEGDWNKAPFVRDRLNKQIIAGGGKVYAEFKDIPKNEYKNTKLITNVPNTTAKMLQCLSVGIPVCTHNWIIRSCAGQLYRPAENELPAGWNLEKDEYVEMFKRPSGNPLDGTFVIIPVTERQKHFASFWQQICENAGAIVLLAEKQDAMDNFMEGVTVILTNSLCPSWALEKANELQIPLLSTTWVTQCLIQGKRCEYDALPQYMYNYKNN